MSESRAEYYRQYRQRKKTQRESTESEFVVTVLHDVVQQLQQIAQQMQVMVDKMQQCTSPVAQQFATSNLDSGGVSISKFSDLEIAELNSSLAVAQQSTLSVAQQLQPGKKSKRKGSFPPSSPPSHPPQTPPYSSPLLSPQPPKEKAREIFAISSGSALPDGQDWEDDPEAPLVEGKRGAQRDFATWKEFQFAIEQINTETQSDSLLNAFMDWVEYKRERNVNEFYTRKGLLAETQRFIRKHFEEFPVAEAVTKAIANNWQGWDHKL